MASHLKPLWGEAGKVVPPVPDLPGLPSGKATLHKHEQEAQVQAKQTSSVGAKSRTPSGALFWDFRRPCFRYSAGSKEAAINAGFSGIKSPLTSQYSSHKTNKDGRHSWTSLGP